MPYFMILLLTVVLFSAISAQTRQEAVEKFNDLRNQSGMLEKTILSPDKTDIETASRENVGVFRLLPREIYGKSFFTIRGGGAYYSFYFRISDWGRGSDIGFEQTYLQTAHQGCGLMTDLGEVPLGEITKEIPSAVSLVNYQNTKDANLCRSDYYLAGSEKGLKLGETIFRIRLSAIVGHAYLVRSANHDYYDVLVAFQVHRKDTDGSLIIFWKQLEQFETPRQNNSRKVQVSDAEILKKVKSWARPDLFPNLQAEVNNGVITLRGTVPKDKIPYAVQLAHSAGAIKVINFLTVE